MEHNGLFTDLDSSFASLSNCGTSNTNFNDACPTVLPSLNNFKYHQTNLSSNIYQQLPTTTSIQSTSIIDHHQQQHHQHQSQTVKSSSSTSTGLPQTQININNCNNNIIFPLDDGLFADPTSSLSVGTGAPATASVVTQQTNGNNTNASSNSSSSSSNNNSQKNNFIGYLRKETGSSVSCSGGGGGGDNITYNINNINTNIVNNVVNNTDIFTGNQYHHQISKPALGETIINFTNSNNNLNSAGSGTNSMPVDTGSVTSQSFYNFPTNSNVLQGQQQSSIFETTSQSQQQPPSQPQSQQQPTDSYDIGNMGLFPGNYVKYQTYNPSMCQKSAAPFMQSGATSSQQDFASAQTSSGVGVVDPMYSEYPDPLTPAAKIINNFESKNPLKYTPATSNNRSGGSYYGKPAAPEYPTQFNHLPAHQPHHPPSHAYANVYANANGHPKIPPSHNYPPETFPSIQPRTSVPASYQHFNVDDPANQPTSQVMNRHHHSYHPSMPSHGHPPAPSNGAYGNYYAGNGYNAMHHYPSPYPQQIPPSAFCSKPSPSNYAKSNAVGIAPVEHSNFPLQSLTKNYANSKKEFYQDGHFYPTHQIGVPQHPHPNYYEDPKKMMQSSSHRPKVIPPEVYNNHNYAEHHMIPPANVRYQQMPKPPSFNASSSYPSQNSMDFAYHPYQHHKMQKMQPHPPPMSSQQQFHYDQMVQHHHMQQQSPYRYHPPMQAKPHDKIKISIDLEEQINSSKIAKNHHNLTYAYEPPSHHPGHYYHHPQQIHHPHHLAHPHPSHLMASRNMMHDNSKPSSMANINISIRDFLQSWNDDEDENARIVDEERTIRREYNPLFVPKTSVENFTNVNMPERSSNVAMSNEHGNSAINNSSEGSEKFYVLEKYDVPFSELNKLKHLTVINKLPENIVIADNKEQLYSEVDTTMKYIEEIDLTRGEKLYKSEFELEFEACQEDSKRLKPPAIEESSLIAQIVQEKVIEEKCEKIETIDVEIEKKLKIENVQHSPVSEDKKSDESSDTEKLKKALKVKVPKEKLPKIKQQILKLKKEKILKSEQRKVRITKRMKKYSLNPRSSSLVRSLQSICVDFVNTSKYRNFARTQLSIINKHSKKRVLEDFKKKFNFDGMKKPASSPINQKFNHSVRINSLTDMCGKSENHQMEIDDDEEDVYSRDENEDEIIDELSENENFNFAEVPTLKNICKQFLTDMNYDVVENENYIFTPPTLREICETFVYNNRQYFHIEELEEVNSEVPRLQQLCNEVLSNENIFVNFQEATNHVDETASIAENADSNEPIYIVEENSGNVGELFESESLNTFEKTEILRRFQRVANIDDDDEIMRAIGALHVDPIIDNNNECDVSNKNIPGSSHVECFPDANELSMLNSNDMKFDSELAFYDDLLHSVQYEEILNDDGHKTTTSNTMEILRHQNLNRHERRQQRKIVGKIVRKSKKFHRRPTTRRNCDKIKKSLSTSKRLSESHYIDDAKDSTKAQQKIPNISTADDSTKNPPKVTTVVDVDKNPIRAESNLPKLPSVLPSINEYRLERKSNHRNSTKDKSTIEKPRKLTFEESLMIIDGVKIGSSNHPRSSESRRSSSSSQQHHEKSSSSRHHRRHHHRSSRSHRSNGHRRHRSRSRSRSREASSRRRVENHHKSSREKSCYKKDQIKHSEAKRLVIPSYKLYDKNLDIKLKTMPYVKMEREERLDEMMKRLI